MLDPVHRARVTLLMACVTGVVATGGTAWWALRPHGADAIQVPVIGAHAPAPAPPAVGALELSAFQTRIWDPPAPPPPAVVTASPSPPPPAPPAPAPPLRLQLVAIVNELDGPSPALCAALYDPDQDRLHLVMRGQRIGGRTVSGIGTAFVELTEGVHTRRLELTREASRE